MWSMWNAPSDRDYYDPEGLMEKEEEEEPEFCFSCYARSDQACEEWCETNRPASEPAPVDELAAEPNIVAEEQMRPYSVYVFVCLCGHEIESAELDCECPHCGRMLEVNWRCELNGNRNQYRVDRNDMEPDPRLQHGKRIGDRWLPQLLCRSNGSPKSA
jgi:hypothetical protein